MNYRSIDRSGNAYCGPLVLAAILGCTTADAAQKLRQATVQRREVRGTNWWELDTTLRYHGFATERLRQPHRYIHNRKPGTPASDLVTDYAVYRRGAPRTLAWPRIRGMEAYDGGKHWAAPYTPVKAVGPTLAGFMRSNRDPDAFYIVEVFQHWVLVKGRKFVDTFTKGEWVFLRSAPHRRKRVINVYKVERRV